ncbi:hypothetical protein PCASD_17671 [Puccinia coronata f. sp. avenae]|uniref:Uncharacterized protein n=1 Tax=Puccinia coronata f. sp. avenae TaxID=200324 RepID=A0A2N5SD74_9BASI|nr:hypothetical protein PCASD_17671 [Puccinia coronata f. sp. avenae]
MNQQLTVLSSFLVWSTEQSESDTELYFTHIEQPAIDEEKKNRLVGLVKGLVNFTAILSHGLNSSSSNNYNNNSQGIRSVHSKNHKILFLQPEPSFYLAAVINLLHTPSPAATGTSKLSDTFNILSKQKNTTASYEPSDVVLLNSLASAAQEYLLLHGSMRLPLRNNLQQLRETLEKFWSVWLWRWNVGKTGCGAVDFHELFGGLQSPFLNSAKIPRTAVDQFTHFATQICPAFPILPILIHDRTVVYLPSQTQIINRHDITTLARYLLSLLAGSEAKRESPPPPPPTKAVKAPQDEQNMIMKRLSTIDFGSLANLQPKFPSTTSAAIQPATDWANRALKWASTSLVLPVNHLFDNDAEADSLDQLLRADIGLPTRTTPHQLVRIKSSLSSPELVTHAVPSSIRLASQKSASSITTNQSSSPTKLNYPHNLLKIYSPVQSTRSGSIHYPHNLENIYESMRLSGPGEEESGSYRLPTVPLDQWIPAASGPPEHHHTASPSPGGSKHNPRSASFNVEHALADAMSERSIGSLAALEFVRSEPFAESSPPPPSHGSAPSGPPPTTLNAPIVSSSPKSISRPASSSTTPLPPLKQIKIYVNSGRLMTSVYWIQRQGWTLAWVAEPVDDPQVPNSMIGLSEVNTKEALLQATTVLDGFAECGWPEDASRSEEPKPPEAGTSDVVRRPPKKVSRQRFLVRDASHAGCFYLQSPHPHAGWLSRNDIWPGKAIPPDELEASLGLLHLVDANAFGLSHSYLPSEPATPGTLSLYEESFLRTSSGQWLVAKKIPHHRVHRHQHPRQHQQPERPQQQQNEEGGEDGPRKAQTDSVLEAFLVLPRGLGTLIEADNEMRMLELQAESFQFNLS